MRQSSLNDISDTKPKLEKDLDGLKNIHNNKIKPGKKLKEESESEDEESSKKLKRKHSADEDYAPDQFSKLVGSKRRKVQEQPDETPIVVKPKLRRVEKTFVPVLEKLSIEELMETNTYDRFNKTLDQVLKVSEDIDFAAVADDGMVPAEYLLNRHKVQELYTEAAKLKTLGATEMIPTDRLVRLLHILEINIRGGDRISPISDVSSVCFFLSC